VPQPPTHSYGGFGFLIRIVNNTFITWRRVHRVNDAREVIGRKLDQGSDDKIHEAALAAHSVEVRRRRTGQ